MTKQERQAALKRVQTFKKEFMALPEHSIKLNGWYSSAEDIATHKHLQDFYNLPDPHCGSVGCVGGHAEHSKGFKEFVIGLNFNRKNKERDLFNFFGVSYRQAHDFELFNGVCNSNMTQKNEALARLNKVIKFHKERLALSKV